MLFGNKIRPLRRRTMVCLLCLVAGLTVTCVTTKPQGPPRRPKIGLVLGGGAARGIAHVGVIRVLEQENIPIDLIVGTSVGSMIGALYASNRNSFDLEWTAFKIRKEDIFDFSLLSLKKKGLAKGEKIIEFIKDKVPMKNIQDLKMPFCAVAVNLNTGKPVVMDSGSVADAVRASCSIPGVFVPVQLENGQYLVDGGVIGNIAPEVAWDKGMDIVIVADVGEDVANENTEDMVSVIMQSISILCHEIDKHKKIDADVLIKPDVSGVGMIDFTKKKELIQAGIQATRKVLPEIRDIIAEWEAMHGGR